MKYFYMSVFLLSMICGIVVGNILLENKKHHVSPAPSPTPPVVNVTPSPIKHYTITLYGQVFHTTDWYCDVTTGSLQFRDTDGTNVVLFDAKDAVVTEDK